MSNYEQRAIDEITFNEFVVIITGWIGFIGFILMQIDLMKADSEGTHFIGFLWSVTALSLYVKYTIKFFNR
jgi:hypothetical protein